MQTVPPWQDVWRLDIDVGVVLIDASRMPYDKPLVHIVANEAVRRRLLLGCPELVCWDVPGPEESLVELRWIEDWSPATRLATVADYVIARFSSLPFDEAVECIVERAPPGRTLVVEIGTAGTQPTVEDNSFKVLVDPHWIDFDAPRQTPFFWSRFAVVAAPFCNDHPPTMLALRRLVDGLRFKGYSQLELVVDPTINIDFPPDLQLHVTPWRPGSAVSVPPGLNSARSPGTTPARYDARLPDSVFR